MNRKPFNRIAYLVAERGSKTLDHKIKLGIRSKKSKSHRYIVLLGKEEKNVFLLTHSQGKVVGYAVYGWVREERLISI